MPNLGLLIALGLGFCALSPLWFTALCHLFSKGNRLTIGLDPTWRPTPPSPHNGYPMSLPRVVFLRAPANSNALKPAPAIPAIAAKRT